MNHKNLGKLLNPRSVAIIGANDKNNAGAQALTNAIASGFAGPIYPVNPHYQSLQGQKCYASLAELPTIPDTLVVAIPAQPSMTLLHEAASIGVPSMVFFNGGFTDAGDEPGRQRNLELLEVSDRAGIAVGGPNCMGLFSRRHNFDSSFIPQPRDRYVDAISIVSQSGGLVNAFIELATNRGLGFNYVISSGNEAVLSTAHYLEWLAEDPDTKVIISVVEGPSNGQHFRNALERATRFKPVVVLKLGRSESGRRAVLAHTGALAGNDVTFAAMCKQCGATVVETVDAALEVAAMFLKLPLPRGDRVVLFSGSGGATTLATDLASNLGLKFQPLSPTSGAALQQIFEARRPFGNPFDVGAYPLLARNEGAKRCLETLVADDSVDLIGCALIVQRDLLPMHKNVFDQLAAVAAHSDKPIVLLAQMTSHWHHHPADLGIYAAGSLDDGLTAIRGLVDYAAYRRGLGTAKPVKPAAPALPVPASGRSLLTEFESKRVLAQAGLPVTRETLVQSADEALAAAAAIGFPVALKVQSPDLIHKSDAGAIMLDLKNADELRHAFEQLQTSLARPAVAGLRIDGLLVQEMVSDGVEIFLGMHRDATFGPVVLLSPGGVFVELFPNSAVSRLPPLSEPDAEAMINSSDAVQRLLGGFRGRPAADRASLVRLIEDFASFVVGGGDHLAAIDLNPVIVLPQNQGVQIVDATIEFVTSDDDVQGFGGVH